jgi:hypothetical protein
VFIGRSETVEGTINHNRLRVPKNMRKNGSEEGSVKIPVHVLPWLGCALVAVASAQPSTRDRPDLSGLYRAGGLPVQPCGANEWMRRSLETDEFCFGSLEGWPFSEQGLVNWKAFSPIDDPVLRCRETFPRTAMRGRPMRMTYGADTIEIAYWFGGRWHPRTIHLGQAAAPAGTQVSDFGYSVGRFIGDSLIVETTSFPAGPLFNDHKPVSAQARTTERYWRAPDGENLLMDIALQDPVNYTKTFLINRLELISSPDARLDPTECTPSSIWADDNDDTEAR